jgi:hypothetical protein
MIERVRDNGRLAGAILLVVILVVVNVVLVMQWRSAQSDASKAETDLKVAQVSLTQAQVQYDVVELRKQEADLERNPEFPTTLPIVGLSLFLADGAVQNQVSLTEVKPPAKVGTEKVGTKTYPAYATAVTARGSLTKLILFLEYIEGGGFTSVRVQDLAVKQDAGAWEADFTVVVVSQS